MGAGILLPIATILHDLTYVYIFICIFIYYIHSIVYVYIYIHIKFTNIAHRVSIHAIMQDLYHQQYFVNHGFPCFGRVLGPCRSPQQFAVVKPHMNEHKLQRET